MYYKRHWAGITPPIQCYSYVLNNMNLNPVTSTIFSLLHHKQCGCDSHPFSCFTGSIYFSPEQGGEIVKETAHVCRVNSLGMGGYFPSVSHTPFYGTETHIYKGKAVPLQAWSGPEGFRKLSFPDFMTTAQDGGKVVSLTHRPPLPRGKTPGTHFC